MNNKRIISRIAEEKDFTASGIVSIIEHGSPEDDSFLFEKADAVRKSVYGNKVYVRGLIEFSNFCRNDCFYCGIRKSNRNAVRYRLTEDEILECCKKGYQLGYRTFVLQSGEDPFFTDEKICSVVRRIKENFSDCAVTLSIGEKSEESYKKYSEAGADRYLLRHETADCEHYKKLHPAEMDFKNRIRCLETLKKTGFQTGAGFMVGSPYQTTGNLISDLLFLKSFQPHMVGIGPFIPQADTPFGSKKQGSLRNTLVMTALSRLILPHALIPATTALGTIHPEGRELGLKAGANVVMPNLSPVRYRKLYALYDNKICTGEEAAECRHCLESRVKKAGYEIVTDRGDFIP
ncbi:MAG: [FeFe] hydrogenase H-cluster radical SAM maturase HydE [Porcipelethomonas sp.]